MDNTAGTFKMRLLHTGTLSGLSVTTASLTSSQAIILLKDSCPSSSSALASAECPSTRIKHEAWGRSRPGRKLEEVFRFLQPSFSIPLKRRPGTSKFFHFSFFFHHFSPYFSFFHFFQSFIFFCSSFHFSSFFRFLFFVFSFFHFSSFFFFHLLLFLFLTNNPRRRQRGAQIHNLPVHHSIHIQTTSANNMRQNLIQTPSDNRHGPANLPLDKKKTGLLELAGISALPKYLTGHNCWHLQMRLLFWSQERSPQRRHS